MKPLGGGALAPQEGNIDSGTEVTPPENMENTGGGALAPQRNVTKCGTEVLPPYSQRDGVLASQKSETEVTPPKRVNLPHIDIKGHYQFVTFRTHDSIDNFLKRLSDADISSSVRQYKIDAYLDISKKGCHLHNKILQFLKDFFLKYDKELYELIAFTIMPNHIHILFKQKIELAKILQQLKGSSAFKINKMLERKGKFWEDGYYDKLIRDENHFSITYDYIKHNAIKAGLDDAKERFYGIYD